MMMILQFCVPILLLVYAAIQMRKAAILKVQIEKEKKRDNEEGCRI